MFEVIRYSAPLAEEDPKGSLIGVESVSELEEEVAELYRQGEELYEVAERLAHACETTKQGKKVTDALRAFREVTGG